MRKVMIATPAHDKKTSVYFTDAVTKTVLAGDRSGIEVLPVYWPGEAIVQVARNNLAKIAIDSGVDSVVFIDADECWKPDDFISLLAHPVDVVGLAVRKKDDAREHYNIRVAGGAIATDMKTGLWIVDGIGTGFLRLSRKALLALWDRSLPYTDDYGNENRMMFEVGVLGGRLVSEDMAATMKLRDAGFAIHVDPRFTVSHVGEKVYPGGDLAAWVNGLRATPAA